MARVVLASKCLSGARCRYHGKPDKRFCTYIAEEAAKLGAAVIWFCPEELAGLPTPRPAARFRNGRLYENGDTKGKDLTPLFEYGAKKSLELYQALRPMKVFLFAKSPSCDPRWGITGKALVKINALIQLVGEDPRQIKKPAPIQTLLFSP